MTRSILIALLVSSCSGETHRVDATTYYNSFHHRHPVLKRVVSGDTVVTKTIDASGRDVAGKAVASSPNPLTGPFYVEGAAPGDAVAITFRRIRMNRNWGWSAYRLGLFALAPGSIETLYPNRYKEGAAFEGRSNIVPWDLDLKNGTVRLREPVSKSHRMEFAARAHAGMCGCSGSR